MKKHLLLYAALVIALAPGCAKKPAESGSGPKAGRGPVPVRTALVERRDISEVLLFTGELESPLAVEVKPKIQGRLEKLELESGEPTTEGAEVKAGEVIAELDRRELEAQVALAEAQARQAEVTLADRERERRRLEALFAEEVATEQARDAAVTAHESAKAAEAQARAQLELAKVNLDETRIRAPMDGVVMERRADPGAMVGPSAAIVRIAQMNPLRLMLAIRRGCCRCWRRARRAWRFRRMSGRTARWTAPWRGCSRRRIRRRARCARRCIWTTPRPTGRGRCVRDVRDGAADPWRRVRGAGRAGGIGDPRAGSPVGVQGGGQHGPGGRREDRVARRRLH
jgi:multidrug efflux pump subunit AcrA (membrane-fusion protein)